MPVSVSNVPQRPRPRNTQGPEQPVLAEYELPWGFYYFSQTVDFEYDEVGLSGISSAQITINGFFTANAEIRFKTIPEGADDQTKCDKLLERYGNLRKYLLSVINKPAPDDPSKICTEQDKRCVRLPNKLRDNTNGPVYAIPTSFSTTEISPEILKYTIQFKEPPKVPCKLNIDGSIINDANVVIVCRRPRISYRTFAFASGSEARVTGIDNRRYTVSGTINDVEERSDSLSDFVDVGSNSSSINCYGFGLSDRARVLISSIIRKNKGIVRFGVSGEGSNSDYRYVMVSSHSVNNNSQDGSVHIEISGEESTLSGVENYNSNSNS